MASEYLKTIQLKRFGFLNTIDTAGWDVLQFRIIVGSSGCYVSSYKLVKPQAWLLNGIQQFRASTSFSLSEEYRVCSTWPTMSLTTLPVTTMQSQLSNAYIHLHQWMYTE